MMGRQSIPNFSTPLKQYAAQVSVNIVTNVYYYILSMESVFLLISGALTITIIVAM